MVDVLKKLFVIQDVVLKINQQYIASAAQDDKYRTEPAFKLQGSYRNMNKMAEKVSSVMNQQELMQMIADHYQGEAQLLTTGMRARLRLSDDEGRVAQSCARRGIRRGARGWEWAGARSRRRRRGAARRAEPRHSDGIA